MSIELNSNRHSVYNLKYHLVVITKYRHECITPKILKEYIQSQGVKEQNRLNSSPPESN